MKFCALSQDAEFGVAVFTIKLLCLSIGKVLMKKKKTKHTKNRFVFSCMTFHSVAVLVC